MLTVQHCQVMVVSSIHVCSADGRSGRTGGRSDDYPRVGADEGGRMGRHSGDAYDAPDEWRPEPWTEGAVREADRRSGHSPVTRRQLLGMPPRVPTA